MHRGTPVRPSGGEGRRGSGEGSQMVGDERSRERGGHGRGTQQVMLTSTHGHCFGHRDCGV